MKEQPARRRRGMRSALLGAGAGLVAMLFLAGWSFPGQEPGTAAPTGYTSAAARTEQRWEAKFRAIPSTEDLRSYMKLLSARPHHLGSPYDKEDEEWIVSKFREWGWKVHVETFDVLFPTPKQRLVELVEPTHFVAKLVEPPVPGDPTSYQQSEQLPTYNAYSIDGDVTAPLVYVNYGVPEDYERLARMGISVKGAIVIARYGESWRGIKPKVAAEHGAVGCLIYSDPHDDGYAQGDVYPKGPWRPREGVQRGSVFDMPLYPGDPLTPGVGATPNAKRLPISQVKVLTKIPVMPISYGDAEPLLAALGGPVAPPDWRGALGITYHIGPGPAKVRLKVEFNWELKPVRDVIAEMPGSSRPEEWVIRGNHYDAWVNGAQDPVSGLVAELEEARAMGELRREGWKPKRTIIYCAWDGEEPGLMGSTEWVEEHEAELRQHAVAYINSDSNGRGYLDVGGSQSLETFINQVAKQVRDPEKGVSVWRRDQLLRISRASSEEEREQLENNRTWRIGALGAGSDYTAFLDHAGVASLNLGYSGESRGGIYHSVYDDFYWFTHFGDPTFVYERALAQTAGTAVMRLADADLLPLNFADLAASVRGYVSQIEGLAEEEASGIRERNHEIAEGVFSAIADPNQKVVLPQTKPVPPQLDFASLESAVGALTRSAEEYQRVYREAESNGGPTLEQGALGPVNRALMRTERAVTDRSGLPGRPWYQNQLYAPGFYTGYGAKTLPAVREAVEQQQWGLAQRSITKVAQVLRREAGTIDQAASALQQAAR